VYNRRMLISPCPSMDRRQSMFIHARTTGVMGGIIDMAGKTNDSHRQV